MTLDTFGRARVQRTNSERWCMLPPYSYRDPAIGHYLLWCQY